MRAAFGRVRGLRAVTSAQRSWTSLPQFDCTMIGTFCGISFYMLELCGADVGETFDQIFDSKSSKCFYFGFVRLRTNKPVPARLFFRVAREASFGILPITRLHEDLTLQFLHNVFQNRAVGWMLLSTSGDLGRCISFAAVLEASQA